MPILTVDNTGKECSCPSTSESPTCITVSSGLGDRLQSSAENNIRFSGPLVGWLQSAASLKSGDAANALLQVLAGQRSPPGIQVSTPRKDILSVQKELLLHRIWKWEAVYTGQGWQGIHLFQVSQGLLLRPVWGKTNHDTRNSAWKAVMPYCCC